jgi:hypothetical protein
MRKSDGWHFVGFKVPKDVIEMLDAIVGEMQRIEPDPTWSRTSAIKRIIREKHEQLFPRLAEAAVTE